ncbi:MAG TPA: tetratricopeptide repeat protein, partial [Caldilineaceae bacterium]|nr:tetratricopeptide repeat protein [Caldilineaceae bacterium]
MSWLDTLRETVGPRWPWLLVLVGALTLAVTIGLVGPQFFNPRTKPLPGQATIQAGGQDISPGVAAGASTAGTPAAAIAQAQGTPAPTLPPAPTPTPTATLTPPEQLTEGLRLHRLGDYVAARDRLATLLASEGVERPIRLQARFQLVKSYLGDGHYSEALAALAQLEGELNSAAVEASGRAAEQELAAKAHFLRAVALAGLGRYGETIAAYRAFLDAYPALAAAIQPRIAQSYLALGDSTGAAAAYRAAADAAAEPAQKVTLLETLAQTYSNLGRYADAVAAYDEILDVARNAGYRAQIHYLAGETLALAGDEAGAIARWRAATEEAPDSNAAHQSLSRLVERQVEFDLYRRGMINLSPGMWLPAINAFTAYLADAPPEDERAADALLGLGQAYMGAGNYSAAIDVFDRLLENYPDCDCFGQAWLDKAASQA